MKLLLDTHIILWAAIRPDRLSREAVALLEDLENDLLFSPISLWEVGIKSGLGRPDFSIPVGRLRRSLLENGYSELAVTGRHVIGLETLPPLHKDPFDGLLLAQAINEGVTLVTADHLLARYPGPIRKV